MPTRILRDGILTSERVDLLNWQEEVFYRRLQSVVDDYGRFYANAKLILAACFPLRVGKISDSDIEKWLTSCVNAALVRVYLATDGKRYVEILSFGQRIQSKSKFPEFFSDLPDLTVENGAPRECTVKNGLGGDVVVVEVVSDIPVAKATGSGIQDSLPAVDGTLGNKPRRSAVPFEEIVSMYHELLPAHQHVEKLTETRKGLIRQRWIQDLPTLDAWRNYFTDVKASKFLTGQTDPKPGKPPFMADLEWLCRPSSFAKVSEGKYHR